jgi:hypothetical protein
MAKVLSDELRLAHALVRRFLGANGYDLAVQALDADVSERLGVDSPVDSLHAVPPLDASDAGEAGQGARTPLIPGVDPGDELLYLVSKLLVSKPTLRRDVQSVAYGHPPLPVFFSLHERTRLLTRAHGNPHKKPHTKKKPGRIWRRLRG